MARVTLGPGGIYGLQGRAGHAVYRHKGGRTVLAQKPVPTDREPTPAQRAVQERFTEGASYASHVLATPELREMYEAEARESGISVYNVALRDYVKRPTITDIDLSKYAGSPGDVITIKAVDDFEVAGVGVVMADSDGTPLEEGAATENEIGWWEYAATQSVPVGWTIRIAVTATDRAGSETTEEVELTIAAPDEP